MQQLTLLNALPLPGDEAATAAVAAVAAAATPAKAPRKSRFSLFSASKKTPLAQVPAKVEAAAAVAADVETAPPLDDFERQLAAEKAKAKAAADAARAASRTSLTT